MVDDYYPAGQRPPGPSDVEAEAEKVLGFAKGIKNWETEYKRKFTEEKGREPTADEVEKARAGYNVGQGLQYAALGPFGFLADLVLGKQPFSMSSKDELALADAAKGAGEAVTPLISPEAGAAAVAGRAKEAFKSKLDPRFADLQYLAAEQARNRAAPTMQQGPQLEQRNNQIELLKQLEAGRGQDTAAKFQGQKALGEAAYRTAQQQGMGGGLAAATEGTRQSQGVVSQVGEGALQQDMATRNMQNLLSTQGRGQDFQVTQAQNRVTIAQQESNNAMVKFYLTLGDDFATAQRRAQASLDKLYHGALNRFQNQQQGVIDSAVQAVGTLFAL